jgi:2-phosphoglycerate kinase
MAESERRNLSDSTADDRRLWVDDAGRRRPFMRGIMIHSLMARGVGFDEATDTANAVRDRLRPREVVSKDEISFELRDILGDAPFADDHALPVPPDISIVDKAGSQHFSKGVLSQSLLAAAIDPNDAFDVAREIERELLYKGIHEIERGDLRALTYGALCRTIGPQAGERYLIWRQYQEPDRPVILLLGGAAGVGKTSLALEVGHRLGIGRMLSTDSVRQIMRIMLSHELAPALHASSYDAWKNLPEDALGDDPVIDGFRAQATTVSVGVRASMDRAVAENASTVIDGVAIVPGMIELDAYRDLADVIFLVVATLDIDAYAGRFASRAKGQSHRAAHRYLENLDGIVRVQDYLLEAAERHAIPIVDNESFERAVVQIIRHVAETLRERRGLSIDEML